MTRAGSYQLQKVKDELSDLQKKSKSKQSEPSTKTTLHAETQSVNVSLDHEVTELSLSPDTLMTTIDTTGMPDDIQMLQKLPHASSKPLSEYSESHMNSDRIEPPSYSAVVSNRNKVTIPQTPSAHVHDSNTNRKSFVEVHHTKGRNRKLSMFQPDPVKYQGKLYKSGEHAYQCSKALFHKRDGIAMDIADCSDAKSAKQTAKMCLQDNSSWQNHKTDVVFNIIKSRYEQNPSFAKELQSTGDREITHTVHCRFWGTGGLHGNGENIYGKLLMRVRDLKNHSDVPRRNSNRKTHVNSLNTTSPNHTENSCHPTNRKVPSQQEEAFLISDSMGKGVHLPGKTCTFSYPGAGFRYINGRIPSILGHTPPLKCALMVGTNDLEMLSTDEMLHGYKVCIENIHSIAPKTDVFLCGMEHRLDKPHLNAKIVEVNLAMEKICMKNGACYIPPYLQLNVRGLPEDVLGRKGLHLNIYGKSELQQRLCHWMKLAKPMGFQTYHSRGRPPQV